MGRHRPVVASLLALLLFLAAGGALATVLPVPAPPKAAAKSYLLEDFHSGRVLAESNADQRVEPASITKLMTAYVVFQELRSGNIHLDDKVTVSEKAWRTPGSRMFIEVGKQVSVEDLLKGMIIQSGNDASVALAEHVAGDEATFAALMNRYAEALGLGGTHYVNSTGLPDPEHYTTPRDIAALTRALIREFPEYYKWYSERKLTYNGITQYNRNKLLWRDPTVDGVKTGHTESAGYCLVSSARRGDMRLISVVLGAKSEEGRAAASQALLNYGFRFFETRRLYSAGEVLAEPRIWKGATQTLPLGLAEDLYVTIPRGRSKRLKATMALDAVIHAPAAKGRAYGTVKVTLSGETVAERPLVALRDVAQGNLWQRLKDEILLMFQ